LSFYFFVRGWSWTYVPMQTEYYIHPTDVTFEPPNVWFLVSCSLIVCSGHFFCCSDEGVLWSIIVLPSVSQIKNTAPSANQ
jgi:hypothetical protein